MKGFISEYGKVILYFLVAFLFIGFIGIALNNSKKTVKNDVTSNSGNNTLLYESKKPTLEIKSTVVKKGTTFNPLNYVVAKDGKGNSITNVEVYGSVDTSKKGYYDIRYTVRDSIGLFVEKKVTFVVD